MEDRDGDNGRAVCNEGGLWPNASTFAIDSSAWKKSINIEINIMIDMFGFWGR